MNAVEIRETYGAIFGMDMMCDGTVPDQLQVGDKLLRLSGEDQPEVRVLVAALQAHRDSGGQVSAMTGIGLRGPEAHLVQPGDVLVVETRSTIKGS